MRFECGTESDYFSTVSDVIEGIEAKTTPSSQTTRIPSGTSKNYAALTSVSNFEALSPSFGSVQFTQSRWIGAPPASGSKYMPEPPLWNGRLKRATNELEMKPGQQELINHFNTYRDILFPFRSPETAETVREAYVLHALNHVFKTRAKVLKNNDKLKANADLEFQDQGYSRPKVLILVPYKASALEIFKLMKKYSIDPTRKVQVRNEERFNDEFGSATSDAPQHPNNGYRFYFDGNVDDCFRVGISVTRTTINMYSPFYKSDIIITSPLGLRLIIGAEGEKERDYDFLSSIELLIVDQAESMLMQNWDHVGQLLKLVNLNPSQTRDTDFSRVRKWSLNGWGKYYRQTILTSAFNSPDINHLFKTLTSNYSGRATFARPAVGEISRLTVELPQAFHRISCTSLVTSADQRFDFFLNTVLPEYSPESRKSILIFVPDYFDFVRLRNHFRNKDMSFGQICEYTTTSNVSRARSDLFHAKRKFFLYTGRFHYHFRPRLRGIKHIIFYQLPEFAEFYNELVGCLNPSEETTCCALYTKYDSLRLQRIVGTTRATRILSTETKVHLFA
eukprot:m.165769 g.165769  ORF g.165769 m.165769 type:complete len:563 (+) comp31396_c0_seq1:2698-4386(+)